MDTAFPHLYECTQLDEMPGIASPAHYYYPGATTKGGNDGILVRVRPERGELWLGTFAFGKIAPKGVSGIFTTPDPKKFCVVAGGEGYFVSANAPLAWEAVQATPILDIRPIPAQTIIVFAEFTRLVAYGASGLMWKTKRVSWDNLKITEVTDAFIRGEFFDVRSKATASFVVDVATGGHEGGIDED